MPHSSGGGGGSFSSHSSHSGGSHSSTPTPSISKHVTSATKHQYVMYHHHHPIFLYSDMPITKSNYSSPAEVITGIGIVLGVIVAFICFFISVRFEPDPLDMDYRSQDIVIFDDEGYLGNTNDLYNAMVEFQAKTGITPAFETVANITDSDELEDYAYDEYVNMFEDESHWLIVYSRDSNSFEWIGMQGDDTDDLLDDYSLDIFNNYITDELVDNQNVEEVFAAGFYDLNGYIYDHGIIYPTEFKAGIVFSALTVICIAVLVYYEIKSKDDSFYEINTKVSDNHVTAYCPNCHGEYVIDLHTICPYCGASLIGNTDYADLQSDEINEVEK